MMNSCGGPRVRGRYWVYMGTYAAAVIVGALLISKPPTPDAPHIAAAIVPLVPLFLALTETFRSVRAMDELQRRIHIEALLFSLLGTVAIVLTLGLLQLLAGVPLFAIFFLFIPICFLYGLGVSLSRRRYA